MENTINSKPISLETVSDENTHNDTDGSYSGGSQHHSIKSGDEAFVESKPYSVADLKSRRISVPEISSELDLNEAGENLVSGSSNEYLFTPATSQQHSVQPEEQNGTDLYREQCISVQLLDSDTKSKIHQSVDDLKTAIKQRMDEVIRPSSDKIAASRSKIARIKAKSRESLLQLAICYRKERQATLRKVMSSVKSAELDKAPEANRKLSRQEQIKIWAEVATALDEYYLNILDKLIDKGYVKPEDLEGGTLLFSRVSESAVLDMQKKETAHTKNLSLNDFHRDCYLHKPQLPSGSSSEQDSAGEIIERMLTRTNIKRRVVATADENEAKDLQEKLNKFEAHGHYSHSEEDWSYDSSSEDSNEDEDYEEIIEQYRNAIEYLQQYSYAKEEEAKKIHQNLLKTLEIYESEIKNQTQKLESNVEVCSKLSEENRILRGQIDKLLCYMHNNSEFTDAKAKAPVTCDQARRGSLYASKLRVVRSTSQIVLPGRISRLVDESNVKDKISEVGGKELAADVTSEDIIDMLKISLQNKKQELQESNTLLQKLKEEVKKKRHLIVKKDLEIAGLKGSVSTIVDYGKGKDRETDELRNIREELHISHQDLHDDMEKLFSAVKDYKNEIETKGHLDKSNKNMEDQLVAVFLELLEMFGVEEFLFTDVGGNALDYVCVLKNKLLELIKRWKREKVEMKDSLNILKEENRKLIKEKEDEKEELIKTLTEHLLTLSGGEINWRQMKPRNERFESETGLEHQIKLNSDDENDEHINSNPIRENELLKEIVWKMKTKIEDLIDDRELLENEITEKENSIREKDQSLHDLENFVKSLQQDKEDLRKQLQSNFEDQDLKEEFETLKDIIFKMKIQIEVLTEQSKSYEKFITSQDKELRGERRNLRETKKIADDLRNENDRLQSQLNSNLEALSSAQDDVAITREELIEMKILNDYQSKENEKLYDILDKKLPDKKALFKALEEKEVDSESYSSNRHFLPKGCTSDIPGSLLPSKCSHCQSSKSDHVNLLRQIKVLHEEIMDKLSGSSQTFADVFGGRTTDEID